MPIQDGKYVTPAWQNGGAPAITAEELTAIGQSIEQNAADIQSANNNIQTANSNIQQNSQDIDSLQTWQSTATGQISNIQTNYLQKSGGTMTGAINMNNKKITNIPTPTAGTDAANKNYADGKTSYRLLSTATATMSNLNFSLTVNPDTVLPNQLFICFSITNLSGNTATSLQIYFGVNKNLTIALNGNANVYQTYSAHYTAIGSSGGKFYISDFYRINEVFSATLSGNTFSKTFSFYNSNPTSATIKVSLYQMF